MDWFLYDKDLYNQRVNIPRRIKSVFECTMISHGVIIIWNIFIL